MADTLGILGQSFDPSQSDIRMGGSGGGIRTASPSSDVNVLSLRIPTRQAPNSVVPLPLLTSHGSGTAGAVDPQFIHLLSLLQPMFARQMGAPAAAQTQGSPSVPGLYPPAGAPSAPSAPTSPQTGQAPTQTAPPLTSGGGGGHVVSGGGLPGVPTGGGFGSLPSPPPYQPPPNPSFIIGDNGGMGGGTGFDWLDPSAFSSLFA